MTKLFAIALGGAIGAVMRYYTAGAVTRFAGVGFPYGTVAVNLLGSFVMGMVVTLFALKFNPSEEVKAFLTVGLLGGFTTFSTYSLDGVLLIERGDWGLAALYLFGSLFLGIIGLFAGMNIGRLLA